jgi:hypothetical protein
MGSRYAFVDPVGTGFPRHRFVALSDKCVLLMVCAVCCGTDKELQKSSARDGPETVNPLLYRKLNVKWWRVVTKR